MATSLATIPVRKMTTGNYAGAEQNRAESSGQATGARSNARMRMSAIGWPVAAILPLDNIGAM